MFTSKRNIVQRLVLICFILVTFGCPLAFAKEQPADSDYFAMSIEELLSTDVTLATLTVRELSKVPAAITIITREDIESTPARHILDLIEVYVPGAMFLHHTSGPPYLRLRGLRVRNYKTILLVNGRPVNQKAYFGSTIEIFNWDLNDI